MKKSEPGIKITLRERPLDGSTPEGKALIRALAQRALKPIHERMLAGRGRATA
jgi:hypothetical protein